MSTVVLPSFTASGVLWCVANVFSTYDYTVVYNNDTTVDSSTTERFSCIVCLFYSRKNFKSQ